MKRAGNPGRPHVHSKRWRDCVRQVKRRGAAVSPYAVCSAAIDEAGILSRHRRKNPVRDPEHKRLLSKLRQHFEKDEGALRAMRKRR